MSLAKWKIIHKADTGALAFKVKCDAGEASLSLLGREPPHEELILVTICSSFYSIESLKNDDVSLFYHHNFNRNGFIGFWLTWNNGVYYLGLSGNQKPLITHKDEKHEPEIMIGYVSFNASDEHHWQHEASPLPVKSISRSVVGGRLTWKPLTDRLPEDAMIGGMEPSATYIARAHHNGSLAPGKYVPSENAAFVAWGHLEHRKTNDIEILCGYNAEWVRTGGDRIPKDAFVAGYSEVRHGPLYIGRAFIDGHLVTGKVHTLYRTCYLPYRGKEVEVYNYEILVEKDVEERSVSP